VQQSARATAAELAPVRAAAHSSASSIEELCDMYGMGDSVDVIWCKCCNEQRDMQPRHGGNRPGVFQKHESDSTELRPFSQIKQKVDKHMQSGAHLMNAEHARNEEKQMSRRKEAGMRIGRTIYHIIQEGGSYLSFRRLVYKQFKDGVDVGTINHSEGMISNFIVHLHRAMLKKIGEVHSFFSFQRISFACWQRCSSAQLTQPQGGSRFLLAWQTR
jgi:hypothetical protein